jgi:hypothetical protein
MDSAKWVGAAALAIVSLVLWFGFVRQSPEQTALGTIASKGYVAGGTYTQIPIGANRGFNAPNQIAIAEANAFELRLDGIRDLVRASFNTVKSRQFEVGQRVRVQYVRRGLPPLWSRITVVDMTPAEAP